MKKPLSIYAFIAKHRDTLVSTICQKLNKTREFTDKEIKDWILNDPDLYAWAVNLDVKF